VSTTSIRILLRICISLGDKLYYLVVGRTNVIYVFPSASVNLTVTLVPWWTNILFV
jgi:hypothetical protein